MSSNDPTGGEGSTVTPPENIPAGRDPSLNSVFLGDPRLVFLRDRDSGDAVCYEWDPRSDDRTLVMKNERMLSEGFPFTTRLVLNRRDFQPLTAVIAEESENMTTYALRHEARQETGENYRLTVRAYPGPREKDQTYFGVLHDFQSDKQYEVFAAVDANPAIVVIVAIAIICAGVIAADAIKGTCAERCTTSCGGGENVASCEAKVTVVGKWSNGFKNSCSTECTAKCKTNGNGGDGSDGGGGDGSSGDGSSGDGGGGDGDSGGASGTVPVTPLEPVIELPENVGIGNQKEGS